jgi:hypothetical protein
MPRPRPRLPCAILFTSKNFAPSATRLTLKALSFETKLMSGSSGPWRPPELSNRPVVQALLPQVVQSPVASPRWADRPWPLVVVCLVQEGDHRCHPFRPLGSRSSPDRRERSVVEEEAGAAAEGPIVTTV